MRDVLVVDCVGKTYGDRRVLTAASLRCAAGAVTALLGRNGAGKSTLLKIAAGWIAPDYGLVHFRDTRFVRARLHVLAQQGLFYLPDHDLLADSFTIRQQLALVQRRFGGGSIDDVAATTGISDRLDQRPRELSGGERRRAELAAALLRAPACLLADEPYRGIAPHDAEVLSHTFRHLARTGCAVVVTGHEVPTLMDAVDRVVWCTAGTTYDLGTPAEASGEWRFQREYLGWA
ncbi:MAG TPA: ATP-binding cassette domain-containing protein [Gemmatimonadaceae bacterium]|nr:ATP-binding cassette domain-containing protein [Gemmatimonadaceae bacterium]